MNEMKTTDSTDMRPSFITDSGRGNENVAADDLTLPRIAIVQSLSPQRKKNDPECLPGAEEGMLFNTVTGELFEHGILVIPVLFKKQYVNWKKRSEGGGFRGAYDTLAEARAGVEEEGIDIVETAQQFALVSADGGTSWDQAVISMSKSNLSVSKKWNSIISLRNSDRFAQCYELAAVEASSDLGDYYKFNVSWQRWVSEAEYKLGEKTWETLKDANISAYSPKDAVDVETNNGDGREMPF